MKSRLQAALPRAALLGAALLGAQAGAALAGGDPWLDRVRAFEPGPSSGFNATALPGIVLGGPEGLGQAAGSVDVVSLGHGGRIVVSFDDNAVVDGEGDDLVIFENAFLSGSLVYRELAFVEVSADGVAWTMFPFDADTFEGLAGSEPVFAASDNDVDPLAPAAGGDRFDLADVGLDYVRFVRLTDAGDSIDDPGNWTFPGSKGGFDLDAAGAIHSTGLGCVRGTVRRGAEPVAGAKVKLSADGEPTRRRRTRDDGTFRFCRLRPGRDYDATARDDDGRRCAGRAWIDQQQLRVDLDLSFD